MKKQLLFLGLSILFLVSCGSEVTEVKKKAEYIYVEIEECSIPVPRKYNKIEDKDMGKYEYRYTYSGGKDDYKNISILHQKKNSYKRVKKLINSVNTMHINREFKRDEFRIIEVNATYRKRYTYHILGIKTYIVLDGSNEEELNYTLEYCKKTWKLDKGEHNASTAK